MDGMSIEYPPRVAVNLHPGGDMSGYTHTIRQNLMELQAMTHSPLLSDEEREFRALTLKLLTQMVGYMSALKMAQEGKSFAEHQD